MALTRDTLGWTMKATNAVINGVDVPLFKDPKTDDGTKKSARGLLKVLKTDSGYIRVDDVSRQEEKFDSELTTLYIDGEWKKFQTIADIRARLKS